MNSSEKQRLLCEQAEEEIRLKVLEELDEYPELSDEKLLVLIREAVIELGKRESLDVGTRIVIEQDVFNSLRKLDVLQTLIDDPEITEIMINGADRIFVERKGRLEATGLKFSSTEKLEDIIQVIVGKRNQIVNASIPIVDTRLDDGSRVNIILPPVAVDQPIVTIRRFSKQPYTMDSLIAKNSLSRELADFVKGLVSARYNIFVSGGTGSGKTTFLNAMTEYIPSGERVITIEDTAELQLIGVDNLVRMEARNANLDGELEITIRDLVRASLRMRPDRIIVGECRGAEALEVLQANNTGHDGSLSTGHANSTIDMVSRLETMVLMGMDLPIAAIRKQIASGIDIFIHLARLPNGRRVVEEIAEVRGIEEGEVRLQTLYRYVGEDDNWVKIEGLQNTEKLKSRQLMYS